MKTRKMLMVCLCAALLLGTFQTGVSAEQEIDRSNRRDPFAPLTSGPDLPTETLLPSENQETILQQFDLKQLQVIGIVLGELGHHAIVLAPDGKRYMITKGAPIGMHDGTVTDIDSNSIHVTENLRFENSKGEIRVEEAEKTLMLDPLKTAKAPESQFVIVRN